mgnify:CR=1 FL=1
MVKGSNWYEINRVEDVISPALVVYPDRIEANIKMMIQIAGGTDSLRPHIKTHKIAEIINLQLKHGINKFKCATIAEATLLAKCDAPDILLAMQPVGINIHRFFELMVQYPNSSFSTIVDNEEIILKMNSLASEKKLPVSLWLDINNGMNRTGITPNKEAVLLYKKIELLDGIIAQGLHVYDGHIHESDFNLRQQICDKDFDLVVTLKSRIEQLGIKIKTIVAGGTPTFPIHIKRDNIEVCPGTPLLWDQGYADTYKDLKFLAAAVLVGAIVRAIVEKMYKEKKLREAKVSKGILFSSGLVAGGAMVGLLSAFLNSFEIPVGLEEQMFVGNTPAIITLIAVIGLILLVITSGKEKNA